MPEVTYVANTLDQDIIVVERDSHDLVLLSPTFKELERIKGTPNEGSSKLSSHSAVSGYT